MSATMDDSSSSNGFENMLYFVLDNEPIVINWLAIIMLSLSAPIAYTLLFIPAPYGRYGSSNWGPSVNGRLAWFLQEVPAFAVPVLLYLLTPAEQGKNLPNQILLGCFVVHYFQRSFIFPALIRGGKPTPLIPFLLAFVFCFYNGYMQGRFLTQYAMYASDWTSDPRFITGVVLFFTGMTINIHSDHVLRNLRKPGETGYKIPTGGLFDYISGANFFGETLEWFGYALACWSLPALGFAVFTALNIGPRAYNHHMWYLSKFDDYPKSRKAFIPFVL